MTEDNPSDREHSSDEGSEAANRSVEDDVESASVIHETPSEYVVVYPDGSNDVLPKNQKNRIMIEHDLYDIVQGEGNVEFEPKGHEVVLSGTGTEGVFMLEVDDDTVRTSMDDQTRVLRTLRKDLDARSARDEADEQSREAGENLFGLYQDLIANRVRRGTVERFVNWFPIDRVEITDSGWIIDDTFLITYEAENYSLDDVQTHKVSGGEVVEADEEHQFVEFEPTISVQAEEFEVPGSSDQEILSEKEQFFLATVQKFVDTEDSVGGRFAAEVRKEKRRVSDEAQTAQAVVDLANSLRVKSFRDARSGLVHRHGLNKHTLTASFSISQDVIDMMHYSSFDHAGVHEILARREEFEDKAQSDEEFEIFRDIDREDEPDDYEGRWDRIDSVSEDAIIPDLIRNEIIDRFGNY